MSLGEAQQNGNLRRCLHYPGTVPQGGTVTLHCDKTYPARYLMVVKAPYSDALSLCEVEVYARTATGEFYNFSIISIYCIPC